MSSYVTEMWEVLYKRLNMVGPPRSFPHGGDRFHRRENHSADLALFTEAFLGRLKLNQYLASDGSLSGGHLRSQRDNAMDVG